jgi:hypothetical protein
MYVGWGIAALCLLPLLVVTVDVIHGEIALDLDHRVVDARVIEVHTSRRGPDSLQVAFSADGHQHEAHIQQPWFGAPVDPGVSVRIEYLPSDPAVARRAGAHDLVGYAEAVGVLTLSVCAARWWHRRRRKARREDTRRD